MKKVLALVLALVLVLSLSACGKSEEEIQKEKTAVNRELQSSGWIAEGDDYLYGITFSNGYYEFMTLQGSTVIHSDKGTYEIYPNSQEIVCTTDNNMVKQRTFTYKYESNSVKLYDFEKKEYTKVN